MKIVWLLIFSFSFKLLYAQDYEMASIESTVQDFLEGGTQGDVERFKGAFVPDAVQKSIGKTGNVIGMTVNSLAQKLTPGKTMNRTTSILNISYAGIAATATTETIYPNSKIIDMLNLVKISNEWKIVSRVYSRISAEESLISSLPTQPLEASAALPEPKKPATKPAPKKKPEVSWDDDW